jgi:hypothetical protein
MPVPAFSWNDSVWKCRLNNEELIFIMDTREAVVEQLKAKITELASSSSAQADVAVADWLKSIKPALNEALADLQDKKAFLVCLRAHVSLSSACPSTSTSTPGYMYTLRFFRISNGLQIITCKVYRSGFMEDTTGSRISKERQPLLGQHFPSNPGTCCNSRM